MKTAIVFFVCGGGQQFARKQFFEENGCFKKTQCFALEKFAKAAKFFRSPKPSPKDNVHRRFFKKQNFFTIFNLNCRVFPCNL